MLPMPVIASHIPRVETPIPGFDNLSICVYGQPTARNAQERMEQGFYVTLDGQKVARAELLDVEKTAIKEFVAKNYPEHATL